MRRLLARPFIPSTVMMSLGIHLGISALGLAGILGLHTQSYSPTNTAESAVSISLHDPQRTQSKKIRSQKAWAPALRVTSAPENESEVPLPTPSIRPAPQSAAPHPYWSVLHSEIHRQLSHLSETGQFKVDQAPLQLRLTLNPDGSLVHASLPSLMELMKQGSFTQLPALPQDLRNSVQNIPFSVTFTIRLSASN